MQLSLNLSPENFIPVINRIHSLNQRTNLIGFAFLSRGAFTVRYQLTGALQLHSAAYALALAIGRYRFSLYFNTFYSIIDETFTGAVLECLSHYSYFR